MTSAGRVAEYRLRHNVGLLEAKKAVQREERAETLKAIRQDLLKLTWETGPSVYMITLIAIVDKMAELMEADK